MEEINKTMQNNPPTNQIPTTKFSTYKANVKFPHPKLIFLIIILVLGLPLILILGLYYQGILLPSKKELVTYTLRCGPTLRNCSPDQLKVGDRIVLKIDISAALAKYKDTKPDLCYYTNIEPKIEKYPPWYKLTIDNNPFYGGCISNAYQIYQNSKQFSVFITGMIKSDKHIIKAFLSPASSNQIDIKITKEGTEIFNFE